MIEYYQQKLKEKFLEIAEILAQNNSVHSTLVISPELYAMLAENAIEKELAPRRKDRCVFRMEYESKHGLLTVIPIPERRSE